MTFALDDESFHRGCYVNRDEHALGPKVAEAGDRAGADPATPASAPAAR